MASDPNNFIGVWKDYMHIRITIDVTLPIKKRIKIRRDDSNWFWVNFKYEKLNTFCFVCSITGHAEKFYQKIFETSLDLIEKPYGLSLRAASTKKSYYIDAQWRILGVRKIKQVDIDGRRRLKGGGGT